MKRVRLGIGLLVFAVFLGWPALAAGEELPVKAQFAGMLKVMPTSDSQPLFSVEVIADGMLTHFGKVKANLMLTDVMLYDSERYLKIGRPHGAGTITMFNGNQILGRFSLRQQKISFSPDGMLTAEADLMVSGGTGDLEGARGKAVAYIKANVFSWKAMVELKGTLETGVGLTYGVQYGKWERDPEKDRWFCQVRYPSRTDSSKYNTQTLVWYPNDNARKGYYYFANNKGEIWGRCVCPADPGYKTGQPLRWWHLKGDQWVEPARGEAPVPSDGDLKLAVISRIPVPPR